MFSTNIKSLLANKYANYKYIKKFVLYKLIDIFYLKNRHSGYHIFLYIKTKQILY